MQLCRCTGDIQGVCCTILSVNQSTWLSCRRCWLQAASLLSPSHFVHIPRQFFHTHFDVSAILRTGINLQVPDHQMRCISNRLHCFLAHALVLPVYCSLLLGASINFAAMACHAMRYCPPCLCSWRPMVRYRRRSRKLQSPAIPTLVGIRISGCWASSPCAGR
jgi:hypothetical protein